MSTYEIEKNIAIAPRKHANDKYPFATMSVGDSFRLADDTLREYQRVQSAMNNFVRSHPPMKFGIRTDTTGVKRCVRVV